jgi:hypothetical protein
MQGSFGLFNELLSATSQYERASFGLWASGEEIVSKNQKLISELINRI